jgi:tetratricopeptide (TPR) repeat protein
MEQALIQAMAARYSADPQADRAALNAAYASAMGEAVARFPHDANVNVLFAESVMDLSPWDYWDAGGLHPKGRMGEAIAALEKVLRANPDHAGAIHLYIHAVEASTDPQRAEAPADRLGRLAPGAGHLVHMPSHIYYRVGRYLDSLEANRQAVAADEAYFARYKASGIYPNAYYPHNVHFLLVSAQMAGDGKAVIESAAKLDGVISNDFAKAVPFVQSMKAAPYFAHVQFSTPQAILALPDPGGDMPFLRAMWHYARGVAQASRSDFAGANAELDAIARIAGSADFSQHKAWGVPAHEVLAIAQHVVKARVAQRRGDLKAAAEEFRAAVALQDQLPYMEPPYWYYPVRQSLGATLLMSGDLDGAEAAFRESLARAPSNGWSLYGLREVYRKRGDPRAAEATEALLQRAWIGARGQRAAALSGTAARGRSLARWGRVCAWAGPIGVRNGPAGP